jgi:anthranilate phosphoribosyltransferase
MDRQEAEEVFARLMEIDDTKVQIGIKYMIRAMQVEGFGYDEIMTMRNAMISRDFSKINFVES